MLERFAAVVESIAFLIASNFDLMRQRGGLSRSDWLCRRLVALFDVPLPRGAQQATLLRAAALADPALFGGTRLHPSQATAPPRFEAGQLAPAARCALESRRTRFESALGH